MSFVWTIVTFFLGVTVGIYIQSRETDRIQAMWRENRKLIRQHFKQCAGVKKEIT